ncbi:MAG: hypothetical protein U0R17_05685 [Acidimicrobiia bacterium]
MSASMEETVKPHRINRYHITLIALAISVALVSALTIVGSTKSGANPLLKTKSVRLSANNDVVNPPIKLDCEKPVLTLALVLDRSGSVSEIDSNPNFYKESVNRFLSSLSNILISRGGEANVLLYAFGSRTVSQNKKTASNQLITRINDTTSLDVMKQSVNEIFFSKAAYGNDDSTMNASENPNDVARGYNAGVRTPTAVPFTYTNWDDAFNEVAKVGSASYADSAPGKHIDLTLMLTDGKPNVNNGSDRVFQPSDVSSYDAAQGRIYSADTVRKLRQGEGSRPPMVVRGVLINSDATSAMDEVFGAGSANYSTADNFESDLQKVLDDIIESIDTDDICKIEYVTPAINVSLNKTDIVVDEGSSDSVKVTVRNDTIATNGVKLPLEDVAIYVNGVQRFIVGDLGAGETRTFTISINIALGGMYPPNSVVFAKGYFREPPKKYKIKPGLNLPTDGLGRYIVNSNSTYYRVEIDRLALPA